MGVTRVLLGMVAALAVSAGMAQAGTATPPPPVWTEQSSPAAGNDTGHAQWLLGGNIHYHSIVGNVGGDGDPIDTFKFHWDADGPLVGSFDQTISVDVQSIPIEFLMFLRLLDANGNQVGDKVLQGQSFVFSNLPCDGFDCPAVLLPGDYYFQISAAGDPPYSVVLFDLNPDVGLRGFDVVPEPGMLALFGLGLAGLGALRRKVS